MNTIKLTHTTGYFFGPQLDFPERLFRKLPSGKKYAVQAGAPGYRLSSLSMDFLPEIGEVIYCGPSFDGGEIVGHVVAVNQFDAPRKKVTAHGVALEETATVIIATTPLFDVAEN
jgi:hypothetical protein